MRSPAQSPAPFAAPEAVQPGPGAASAAAHMKASDEPRLRALVDGHWAYVGRLLRHLGVTDLDLEDAVQQVFLVISGKLDQVRPGSERAFLSGTAVHIAARVRRTRGRARVVGGVEDASLAGGLQLTDPAPNPEELLDRGRALVWLDLILASMDLDVRSVFVLYEVEEMTMAQIAEALEIPAGTVASRLRRGRELFQQQASRFTRAPVARGDRP